MGRWWRVLGSAAEGETVRREMTRRAVVRDGRSPPRFRRPYSPRGDFGKISPFQGIGASLDSAGCRSLTAAQAANEFTRNCVLGFRRKRPNFPREARYEVVQSALMALCVPPFVFLLRCLVVPRLRYEMGYALFISTGANANAAVQRLKAESNTQKRLR